MTSKEEEEFRKLYSQWPIHRLIRAATVEKEDYRPEAIQLMLQELEQRGVDESNMEEEIQAAPERIARVERDTFMFPASLNRLQYLYRLVCWGIVFVLVAMSLEFLPKLQPTSLMIWVLCALIYRFGAIDRPRTNNAGFSPYLLFLFIVPGVNVGMQIVQFLAPPKKV